MTYRNIFIAFAFLLLSNHTQSQEVNSFLLDSTKFCQIIKDKRIILLGEQTHGDGAHFKAKVELIEYLHKVHGYNVLLFEQDFRQLYQDNLDFNIPNQRGYADTLFNSLFRIWQTKEVKELCAFIEEKGGALKVGGLDPQVRYGQKFQQNMIKYCQNLDYKGFHRKEIDLLSNLFTDLHYPFKQIDRNNLVEWLKEMRKNENMEGSYTAQQLQTLIFFVDYCFYGMKKNGELFSKSMNGNIAINIRDQSMAENAIWYIEKMYPNEKIMIWAHNSHILSKSIPSNADDSKMLGQYLKEEYQNKLLNIAFTSSAGKTKMVSYTDASFDVNVKKNSFEYYLKAQNVKDGLIDLSQLTDAFCKQNNIQFAYLTHFEKYRVSWKEYADLLYYTRLSYPAETIKLKP